MNHLEQELATIRVCGALRDLPLRELQDSVSLARIFRAAIQREIIRRESVTKKESPR
jgi:hypothetical protein